MARSTSTPFAPAWVRCVACLPGLVSPAAPVYLFSCGAGGVFVVPLSLASIYVYIFCVHTVVTGSPPRSALGGFTVFARTVIGLLRQRGN
jgi:hypothetical protein